MTFVSCGPFARSDDAALVDGEMPLHRNGTPWLGRRKRLDGALWGSGKRLNSGDQFIFLRMSASPTPIGLLNMLQMISDISACYAALSSVGAGNQAITMTIPSSRVLSRSFAAAYTNGVSRLAATS